MALVLGLVATVVAIVGGLGTLTKWLLDAQIGGLRGEMTAEIAGLRSEMNVRFEALEGDMHLIKAHLLGVSADS